MDLLHFNDSDSGKSNNSTFMLLCTDYLAAVVTEYSQMETLEEFWLARDIIQVCWFLSERCRIKLT